MAYDNMSMDQMLKMYNEGVEVLRKRGVLHWRVRTVPFADADLAKLYLAQLESSLRATAGVPDNDEEDTGMANEPKKRGEHTSFRGVVLELRQEKPEWKSLTRKKVRPALEEAGQLKDKYTTLEAEEAKKVVRKFLATAGAGRASTKRASAKAKAKGAAKAAKTKGASKAKSAAKAAKAKSKAKAPAKAKSKAPREPKGASKQANPATPTAPAATEQPAAAPPADQE